MSDPSQVAWGDMQKCVQAHNELRDSLIGALNPLTLAQKQKLLVVVQNWIEKQQKIGVASADTVGS